jgi:hypothetical protein
MIFADGMLGCAVTHTNPDVTPVQQGSINKQLGGFLVVTQISA